MFAFIVFVDHLDTNFPILPTGKEKKRPPVLLAVLKILKIKAAFSSLKRYLQWLQTSWDTLWSNCCTKSSVNVSITLCPLMTCSTWFSQACRGNYLLDCPSDAWWPPSISRVPFGVPCSQVLPVPDPLLYPLSALVPRACSYPPRHYNTCKRSETTSFQRAEKRLP